ncbi:TonB-dependent receptor [Sinomicrobium kalidii]|uniref:TonB-dependent receptor n=1 Tax=Sinomicrobium kalidii TaxID=2900738 RepID=UPI001E517171|nr:TonB-dependent receptor [Sinomicrobium kalidii]UGU16688.1 TonB-dependent receptor [Sinomicrobium kalidii]
MFKKFLLSTIMVFACAFYAAGQEGTITGKVMDGEFDDILPFANIVLKGTTNGTTSDFDGLYTLNVEAGTHTIVFSFVGYETKEITGVEVAPGGTVELNVTLNPSSAQLDEVVVTTTVRKNTEAAVLNFQKKSVTLLDGLSSESIKRTGASDIASAVKRVPGVSVQDGKYVYVRGLGDRYTKSILNGMDIPGLDPDKNTVQMDIFPTSILENVIVVKSASAEFPADFTGGVVDIVTKDFPSKKQMSLSLSGGFNPDMHFKDNYITYEGGNTDFLGFDDGNRKMPISSQTTIPHPAGDNGTLEGITRSFNSTLATKRQQSMPNFGLGFSYGNRYDVGDNNTLGFIASLDYKNETEFYEGFESGLYQKHPDASEYELRYNRRRQGDLGINNVLLSGLAGLSYKTGRSKYRFNILHIQNGRSQAAFFNQSTQIADARNDIKDNLEYTERSVTNALISGKHTSEDTSFTTEWSLSPTLSKVKDKDVRLTTYQIEPDGYSINDNAGLPMRLWRDLEETNVVGKVDFTKDHSMFGHKSVLKFGGLYSYKKRDYSIYNYEILHYATSTQNVEYDPNSILAPGNIWTPETNAGSYIRGNYQPANTYESNQNTAALYVSNEFKLSDAFRAIIGVRGEYFTTFFTGQDNSGDIQMDNEKTIDKMDIFPSANLIYGLNENTNLRASYYRTTARPSFKELSVVQIRDLLTDIRFIGNLELEPTYIDNLDLRYEFFGEEAQMVAVSGFYKHFKDPIEIVAYNKENPTNVQPRNAESAQVFGVELEARKNFGFLTEGLKDLSLNLNVSIIDSKIDMTEQEFDARKQAEREGENTDDSRQLQGQSPYLINAGLNYKNEEIGLESGLFYNVQGKTLEVVGSAGLYPDVYTMPFNSLNFNFSKTLGDEQRSKISIKVENLLGDDRESQYESFRAANQNFSFRAPGTEFSIGYSYRF